MTSTPHDVGDAPHDGPGRDDRREAIGLPPHTLDDLIANARAGAVVLSEQRRRLRQEPDAPGFAFDLYRQQAATLALVGELAEHLALACPGYATADANDEPRRVIGGEMRASSDRARQAIAQGGTYKADPLAPLVDEEAADAIDALDLAP